MILLFFLLLLLHSAISKPPPIHLTSFPNNTISIENHNDEPGRPSFVFSLNHNPTPTPTTGPTTTIPTTTTICFAIVLDQTHPPPLLNIPSDANLGCTDIAVQENVQISLEPTNNHCFQTNTDDHYHYYRLYAWLPHSKQDALHYSIVLNSCCSKILRQVDPSRALKNPTGACALVMTDTWVEYPECVRVCPPDREGTRVPSKTNHRLSARYSGRALLGAPMASVGVGYGDVLLLGLAMNVNPNLSNFVELGTYNKGTTSLYLGMAARMRVGTNGQARGRLDTFDIADFRSTRVRNAWLPEMTLHLADIEGTLQSNNGFHPHFLVLEKVQQASLVFIDGGLKRIEAFLYAHAAPVGVVLVIHDVVTSETENEQGKPHGFEFLAAFGYVPIFVDAAEESRAWARAWIRTLMVAPDIGTTWRWQEEVIIDGSTNLSVCGHCDLMFTWKGKHFDVVNGSSILEVDVRGE
jgi:hypothetical protein